MAEGLGLALEAMMALAKAGYAAWIVAMILLAITGVAAVAGLTWLLASFLG